MHDGGGSGGGLWSSELMDLQVDYWLAGGNKKDINKVPCTTASLLRLIPGNLKVQGKAKKGKVIGRRHRMART